jgi:uncharacterized membrane protein YfcA
MPVPLALGTNKFQACFGSVSATFHFARQGLIDWRASRLGLIMTAAGAATGVLVVQLIDNRVLSEIMPWLLGAIVMYSIVHPQADTADHPPRMGAGSFSKLMNATSNVTSLMWFAALGQVDYIAGVAMGSGQLVGAKLGSSLVVKKGARFIRPLFLTMVVLTVLRLLYVSVTNPQS